MNRIAFHSGGNTSKVRSGGFLLVFATVCCMTAAASPITINNPSFETPALTCTPGPACYSLNVFDSWTVASGQTGTFRPSVGPGQEFTALPNGLQVAAIGNEIAGGAIYQDLSATLAADTTYTLTFWVGRRSDFPFDSGYAVSLMANGSTLASATGASPAAGSFVQQTLSFATGASPAQLGQTLRIDVSAPFESAQADFDLFALDASPSTTVPEPSTFALLIIGLGIVACACRLRTTLGT
jgi:hypothetical protein